MSIKSFIDRSIDRELKPFTLREFMIKVQAEFYPDQDIEFMDYFLELCDEKNEGQFIVPHSKLYDYGATASNRSERALERINALSLSENEDFSTTEISVVLKRGTSRRKVYMLTPAAFKMILMGATKHAKHNIDVSRYRKYYLFLEKIVKYYMDYQSSIMNAHLMKTRLNASMLQYGSGSLRNDIQEMKAQNDTLLQEVSELKEMGKRQMATLDIMNDKLDAMFDFMLSFARMTIPMWLGSSVIKTQFDNLAKNNSPAYALKRLKVMFVVSFVAFREPEDYEVVEHNDVEYNVRSTMKAYFCCTNFADVCARIRLLSKRHSKTMFMLQPQVVCLYSGEINTEIANLEGMDIFPEKTFATYSRKNKMFEVTLPCTTFKRASVYYESIIESARHQRFQAYQTRIDSLVETGECPVSENILDHMTRADEVFFSGALPFCLQFVDSYTTKNKVKRRGIVDWVHISNKSTIVKRPDMKNAPLGDKTYSLRKLQQLIDANTGNKEVDNMVDQGIISKKDISSLKKLAKLENIDTTEIDFPEDLTDSESDRDYDSE